MAKHSRRAVLAVVCVLVVILASWGHFATSGEPATAAPGTSTASPPPRAVGAPMPFEIRLPSRIFTPVPAPPDWAMFFSMPEQQQVHAIVQFLRVPDAQTRAALAEAGIVLGQPLTGHAYLAAVRRPVRTAAPALKAIRWAGPLMPDDKIAPELKQPGRAPWARRAPGRVELVVKLFPGGNLAAAAQQAKDLGGNLLGQAPAASLFTVSLPDGRERDLAGLDDVR